MLFKILKNIASEEMSRLIMFNCLSRYIGMKIVVSARGRRISGSRADREAAAVARRVSYKRWQQH